MSKWNYWVVFFLLPFGSMAFSQNIMDSIYARSYRVDTQERYDDSMKALYVTREYTREDYERDLAYLYTKNQKIRKISEYCPVKLKAGEDIRHAYLLWVAENKDYVQLLDDLWKKLIDDADTNKKQALQEKVDADVKHYLDILSDHRNTNYSCHKEYWRFLYDKDKPKKSEEEKFSNQYHNLNFYLHPEQKKELLKKLNSQFAISLKSKKICEQKGGNWVPIGMAQSMACITKYPDAGKSCTDNSQCKGGCIQVSGFRSGDPILGQCKENNDRFGCPRYLHNGEGGAIVCID